MPKNLLLATRNPHKVAELAAQLSPLWKVRSVLDEGNFPEVEETGTTFLENAELKARRISEEVIDYVMADDSGLEVDALQGAPGVYSARYAGIDSSDEANNQKVLEELKRCGAMEEEERTARFRCVLVLAQGGERVAFFEGLCEGFLLYEPAGKQGFGYDPLFVPQGYSQSFAQLGAKMKSKLSHRAQAVARLVEWSREREGF